MVLQVISKNGNEIRHQKIGPQIDLEIVLKIAVGSVSWAPCQLDRFVSLEDSQK